MISIYTNKGCPNCEELKRICVANEIDFEEVNVEDDFMARATLVKHDIEELPAIWLSGEIKTGTIEYLSRLIMEEEGN